MPPARSSPRAIATGEAALAALPSLGPVSAQMLVEVGIRSPGALRRKGVLAAYRQLRFHFGRRVTVSFVYALECAIRGIDWRALSAARKAQLKREALAIAGPSNAINTQM